MPLFAVLLISLFLVGCASAPPVSVSGADDPFEDVVQVSTYGYYQMDPLMNIVQVGRVDSFFRGYKNKETNDKTYQLYLRFRDFDWNRWDSLVYLDDGERITKEVVNVALDADCSGGTCYTLEDALTYFTLEEIQKMTTGPFPIRIFSSSIDASRDLEIDPEEAKLFLDAMQDI